MTPRSRFIRARLSATRLRGAALAMALLVPASPARAEVVTLFCQNQERPESSFGLRIDYDRKTVADVRSDGTAGAFVAARITEGDITWDHVFPNVEVFKGTWGRFGFSGSLNRVSGQGRVTYWRMDTGHAPWSLSGLCRRATQKF